MPDEPVPLRIEDVDEGNRSKWLEAISAVKSSKAVSGGVSKIRKRLRVSSRVESVCIRNGSRHVLVHTSECEVVLHGAGVVAFADFQERPHHLVFH